MDSGGLLSSEYLQQEAALYSLSTLMSIIPGDTYAEFEKVYVLFTKFGYHDMIIMGFNSFLFFGSTLRILQIVLHMIISLRKIFR